MFNLLGMMDGKIIDGKISDDDGLSQVRTEPTWRTR